MDSHKDYSLSYRIISFGVIISLVTITCERSNTTAVVDYYSLTTIAVNGSITRTPDKSMYESGETVTLTAVPDYGFVFISWAGDASGTSAITAVTMTGDKDVEAIFAADSTDPVMDIDGNQYRTARIGNQVWTVENLRTTKYKDGSQIIHVPNNNEWFQQWYDTVATPAFCYYDNTAETDTIKKYGALYNWDAVNSNNIAPVGWHVPTDEEWDTLQNYLIAHGYNWDGTTTGNKIAKSLASKADWDTSSIAGAIGNDLTANNKSRFSALPGGFRDMDGAFMGKGFTCGWWTATANTGSTPFFRRLASGIDELYRAPIDRNCGYSVRLVRD